MSPTSAPAVKADRIPAGFQLAGHTIAVRIVPPSKWRHGRDVIGLWNPVSATISIISTVRGAQRWQVFIHEATHALLDVAGHADLSQDEGFVDRIAHLVAQAIATAEA